MPDEFGGVGHDIEMMVTFSRDPERLLRWLHKEMVLVQAAFEYEAVIDHEAHLVLRPEYKGGSDRSLDLVQVGSRLSWIADTVELSNLIQPTPLVPADFKALGWHLGLAIVDGCNFIELSRALKRCNQGLRQFEKWVIARQLPSSKDKGNSPEKNIEHWATTDRDVIADTLDGQQLKLFKLLWGRENWTTYDDLKSRRAEKLWRGQPDANEIGDSTVFEALRKLQRNMLPACRYNVKIENESTRVKLIRPED
jgi:hypothetical protein